MAPSEFFRGRITGVGVAHYADPGIVRQDAVEALFQSLPCARVGTVLKERCIRISGQGGRRLVDIDVDTLRHAFKETLYGV